MNIFREELIDKKYGDGYRLVYFDNDNYFIGAYCKTIEGFMIEFAECNPIIDEDDISPFVSIEAILDRCVDSMEDISAVDIYKTDGTCVEKKDRK